MNPGQIILRRIIVALVGGAIGKIIALGYLSAENGKEMTPDLIAAVDYYVPMFFAAIPYLAVETYQTIIVCKAYLTARIMPAGATSDEVKTRTLGRGKKRRAANLLLGK